MLPPSLYIISSLLPVLVIAKEKEVFEIPGPDKLIGSENTYYFKFNDVPSICNEKSSVLCVVNNESSDKSKVIVNAGNISSKTFVKESNNHFSFTFEDGETCTENGRNQSYKTRFDFFCPEVNEKILNPVILISNDKCSFNFFVWHRGRTCKSEITKGCLLKLPEFEQTLDLSVLRKETFYDVFSGDKSKHFHLNVCGGISGSKKCANSIHVCDVTDDKESKILSGKDPEVVAYYDNQSGQGHLKVCISLPSICLISTTS